ncbi:MAG: hypothetical protein Q9209_004487 [Squamulea sp. 1 TL-2023]
MASSALDSFILGNQVSTSTVWNNIIQKPPLRLRRLSPDQPGAIAFESDHLWGLTFSTSQNVHQFGPVSSPGIDASTLETPPDAVFGLLATSEAANAIPLQDIRTQFGMLPMSTPTQTASLFNRLDPNQALRLSLDTTPLARSALWALSGPVYRTAVALVFVIPEAALNVIAAFVQDERGLRLRLVNQKPRLTFMVLASYAMDLATPASLSVEILASVQTDDFEVSCRLTSTGLELRLSNPQGLPGPRASIVNRLSQVTSGSSTTPPEPAAIPGSGTGSAFDTFLQDIELWYIVPGIFQERSSETDADGNMVSVPGLKYWQIVLIANWQTQIGAVLALQYDSRSTSLHGRLLFKSEPTDPPKNRRFDYEPQLDIALATSKPLQSPPNIWRIFSPSAKAPAQIPSLLSSASVQYSKGTTSNSFSFRLSGSVTADNAAPVNEKSLDSAPDGFSWDRMRVQALIENGGASPMTAIQFYTEMTLKRDTRSLPARLSLDIAYRSPGSWLLRGHVDDLSIGVLYDFFDSSVRDSAVKLLGDLSVRSLEMLYTYDANGEASAFFISAALVLGELELDLSYEYASVRLSESETPAGQIARKEGLKTIDRPDLRPQGNEASWSFEAVLGAASPNTDIGKILDSLAARSSVLPSFVRNIPVGDTTGGKAAVKFVFHGGSTSTVLAMALTIGDVNLTYVSLVMASNGPRKTILRVGMDEIPLVKKVPVIKELPQPFDTMLYLWLDDETEDEAKAGLFLDDIEAINAQLANVSIPVIATKDTNKQDEALPLLRIGHHFMIVDKGTVVLDHNFSDQDAKSAPPIATEPSGPSTSEPAVDPAPTKGAVDKVLPFLSITALSLVYKRGLLGISIDATVRLGPITFSLIGFVLGIELASLTLDDLSKGKPGADIQGLEVMLESPPITLAGIFMHDYGTLESGQARESFRGGVSLGFERWKFLAVGEYAVIGAGEDGTGGFKSVFVYAKLNGPLLTLAFATVSGVRVGLGYNSIVRSPQLLELSQFPFLNDNVDGNSGQDPRKIIEALTKPANGASAWVIPKDDSYWVAAGLTLTAFGILSVTAVLMFAVRDYGFVISVFANGIAQIPNEVKPELTLFYVEIGMLAELNTVEGYFTVQAALAPSSHVLVPACRLTGGFALVNWFTPNVNAGDFVFTVGGVSNGTLARFTNTDGVARKVSSSIHSAAMVPFTGNAYFAVTPKCVMGGAALHMGLEVGLVSAWLDAAIDVFIQFKPFHYTADISVSVGCAISIKVWFIRLRITASVGAALHIEGPDPFGGSAHVDFYLFGFTINFGERPPPPPAVSLPTFYSMVNIPGPTPSGGPSQLDAIDPMMARLKFTLTGGLMPQPLAPLATGSSTEPFPDTGASKPWIVKAGTFACSIDTDFALSAAEILHGADDNLTTTSVLMPNGTADAPAFYSKPMHVSTPVVSRIQISVYRLGFDDTRTRNNGFQGELILKRMPTALWASYSEAEDPSRTRNPAALKDPSNPTMELCMGVSLRPPNPQLVESNIQAFDPSIAFRESIYDPKGLEIDSSIQKDFLASSAPYPEESGRERWEHFKRDWTASSVNAGNVLGGITPDGKQTDGMLNLASRWLGWDRPPPSRNKVPVGGRAPWVLDGALPRKLVDSLSEEYTALPRLSVSATA